MDENTLNISWYGRCCFLVNHKKISILIDPYDAYCGVDIGSIEADILVSSSTWHDHGHIGASPKAHIYSYPGEYEHNGISITGIEAKEDRGTPTVIFNIKVGPFSITNYADFGPLQKNEFDENLTPKQKVVLESTNIAFIRPSIAGDKIQKVNKHNEIALDYCNPSIIFPEHYFPTSFINQHVPDNLRQDFLLPNTVVDEMIRNFNQYSLKEINDNHVTINKADLGSKKIYKFLSIHSQVKYKNYVHTGSNLST